VVDSPLPEKISTQFIDEFYLERSNERLARNSYRCIKIFKTNSPAWQANAKIVEIRFPLWEKLNQLVTLERELSLFK